MVGQGEGWPDHCLLFPLHVRMLDEYFEEQMKEIIRMCARHRQTMLFSATMTDEVPQAPGMEEGKRGEVGCPVGGREPLALPDRAALEQQKEALFLSHLEESLFWGAVSGKGPSLRNPPFPLSGQGFGFGFFEKPCPDLCEQQHRGGPLSAPGVHPHPAQP